MKLSGSSVILTPAGPQTGTMSNNDTKAERERNISLLISQLNNLSRNRGNNLAADKRVELFSVLALLKAYSPESHLLMSECQKILGPPDPIDGDLDFEVRMEPFMSFIDIEEPELQNQSSKHVRLIDPDFAQHTLERLSGNLLAKRSAIMKMLLSHCDRPKQDKIQFIKTFLTKRKIGQRGKEKFSRLIEDIKEKEGFYIAFSVLKTVSDTFRQDPFFPQAISRLYYIRRNGINIKNAVKWANEAIRRAPKNSFMADTLGQIYKKCLMRAWQPGEILDWANKAFSAFKDVEMKAEQAVGPEMIQEAAGSVNFSHTFNNRGLFGFIQVAKIAFEELPSQEHERFFQTLQMEVEDKFDFFEWYLTYSKQSMTVFEPPYFWRDIVDCYKYYTTKSAAESTSFPGLLDLLNHGLFVSRGRRARLEEAEADLEAIQGHLKTTYEANVDDVRIAERYILSNIILSNKLPDSPQLTSVRELQAIMQRFLGTETGRRSSEFYLLILLLFWPEEQPQVVQKVDDEEEQQATEDEDSEDETSEDEEQETRGEPAQPLPDLIFIPDLQKHVTFMKKSFERAEYAKYLRGRYLLPLFFLGKGSGLSKWIHKSRLDAIVEEKVDADCKVDKKKRKFRGINEMWSTGNVWQVPEIQDILLPFQLKPCQPPMMQQEDGEYNMLVCVGEMKIVARVEGKHPASAPYYLGFTIQGPVLF